MALETLKNLETIGGFKVIRNHGVCEDNGDYMECTADGQRRRIKWSDYDELRKDFPIGIDELNNMISLKVQNGPIKEVGVNGCQIDCFAHVLAAILMGFDPSLQSKENADAATYLNKAIDSLEARTKRRTEEGIEGTNSESPGA